MKEEKEVAAVTHVKAAEQDVAVAWGASTVED
jgi:hypothetical protein